MLDAKLIYDGSRLKLVYVDYLGIEVDFDKTCREQKKVDTKMESKKDILVAKLIDLTKSGKIGWGRDCCGDFKCLGIKSVRVTVKEGSKNLYIQEAGVDIAPTHRIDSMRLGDLYEAIRDSVSKNEIDALMAELDEMGK